MDGRQMESMQQVLRWSERTAATSTRPLRDLVTECKSELHLRDLPDDVVGKTIATVANRRQEIDFDVEGERAWMLSSD